MTDIGKRVKQFPWELKLPINSNECPIGTYKKRLPLLRGSNGRKIKIWEILETNYCRETRLACIKKNCPYAQ